MSRAWLHAYIDASAGVAGDMLLGALVDAGADLATLQARIDAVLPGAVRLRRDLVTRAGLRATKVDVDVLVDDPPHRTWRTVADLISAADLPGPVRDQTLRVFQRLADAEGHVHGIPAADVHFHEVGALDSIADVVGVCAALDLLGIRTLTASEVALGSGRVTMAHGEIPIPAPAVAELSLGWRVSGGGRGELTTPTGMALIATLCERSEDLPSMTVDAVGVGAGSRDTDGRPNVTRVFVGGLAGGAAAPDGDDSRVLEANVDDLDPRLWPGVLTRLLAVGAADAWLVPIVMKKGRPAHTLSVLCSSVQVAALRELIFEWTSTIGIREHPVHKHALPRAWIDVQVAGGSVAIKIAHRDGVIIQVAPEFDQVAALAGALRRPQKDLLDAAHAAAAAAGITVGAAVPDTARTAGEGGTVTNSSTTDSNEADGALALRAARAGAAAIAAVVATGGVRTDFKSGGHDLVTTADKAAEAAIIQVIRAARPDDAILGEEGGAHPGTSGSRWLVDPLDGTANFVYGRPDHAVSVGLETRGNITAGAIIRVPDGRWAAASAGSASAGIQAPPDHSARPKMPPPGVNQQVPAAQSLVSFGLPYDLGARRRVFGIIGSLIPQIRGVRIAGSAACDFLALAHGECDAFVGCGLAEWDTAAGQAVVAASGGTVTLVPGPGFDILIAASAQLAQELARLIAAATPRVR